MLRLNTILFALANVLIPAAILIFASGFFPYKPFLPGLAQYDEISYGPPPEAPFDKLVFMVVDALRSDFVYSNVSGFEFTQSLISSGSAIPFTAHATSPTITMPRIKAITTGSMPSFLDVILNFAESDTTSTLAAQDTWLAQMKAKGNGEMHMYGDDTWLKLFPETFDQVDGTSSFFVSDFTEVDNNVTRHVPDVLMKDDWSTVVLHYLGLDHIGHKAGPRSPNMIPKQREMDGIVRQIYTAIEEKEYLKSTLLVLCGDHGMNDAGNHGGSGPGETSPALVFISPSFQTITTGKQSPAPFQEDFRYYSFVEQSDIAPTLGSLLGFPIPKNNLGAFIPQFLSFWSNDDDKLQILVRNANQILNILKATFPSFESNMHYEKCEDAHTSIEELTCEWQVISNNLTQNLNGEEEKEQRLLRILSWLNNAQELMSSTATTYDMSKLVTGQVIAVFAFLMASVSASSLLFRSLKSSYPFIVVTILYGIMMFASSYVEEEQHFWYWTSTTWLALLGIKYSRRYKLTFLLIGSFITLLLATRIARRWNQTGQKFAGEPDIGRTYLVEHKLELWLLVILTYAWNFHRLASRGFLSSPKAVAGLFSAALVYVAMTFKLLFTLEDSPEIMIDATRAIIVKSIGTSLLYRARVVFGGLIATAIFTVASGRFQKKGSDAAIYTLHKLLTLFLITQSRATNIPLYLVFDVQLFLLNALDLGLVEITTTSLLLQYMSFFAFGGSNAISSVDLSSAYNGVSGYNVLAVGFLTFVSNWAGPIYWVSATNLMLLRLKRSDQSQILQGHLSILTVFTTASLVFVMAACTALRAHLFIWTVFSPKYLFSMAWSIGQHLFVNVGLGSGLYWLGTSYL